MKTLFLVATLLTCGQAQAYTVTSLNDAALAIAGDGTLRGAVLASNAGSGGGVIDFNIPGGGSIVLTAGELALTQSVTLNGPADMSIIVSGNNASRIFNVASGVSVAISNLNLTGAKAPNGGGGANGSFPGATGIDGGVGSPGGAILSAGTLTLTQCSISNCKAGTGGTGGNGIANFAQGAFVHGGTGGNGGGGGAGGAIYSTGSLNLVNCSVLSCVAGDGGLGGNGAYGTVYGGWGGNGGTGGAGGAIAAAGSTCTINTCTFSNNKSGAGGTGGAYGPGISANDGRGGDGGAGGAVANTGATTVLLTSCTVTANATGTGGTSRYSAGVGGNAGGVKGSATIRNTIIASNSTGSGGTGPDIGGAIATQGYNLIGDKTSATYTAAGTDLAGTAASPVNPLLSTVANNGGPLLTCLPLSGSPAINTGDPALTANDERGVSRPQGSGVDRGAVEVQGLSQPSATTGVASNLTAVTATLNGTVNPGGSATTVSFEYGPTATLGTTITVPI